MPNHQESPYAVNNSEHSSFFGGYSDFFNSQTVQKKKAYFFGASNPFFKPIQRTVSTSTPIAEKQDMESCKVGKEEASVQKKENDTGLSDTLKSETQNHFSDSINAVRERYNANKPAQAHASASAQKAEPHLMSSHEKQLSGEVRQVVQQKQGMRTEKSTNSAPTKKTNEKQETGSAEMNNPIQRKITVSGQDYDLAATEAYIESQLGSVLLNYYKQILKYCDDVNKSFTDEDELLKYIENPKNAEYLKATSHKWVKTYKYQPGAGDTLHDLAYVAIHNKNIDNSEMKKDDTSGREAEDQLAQCLLMCRDTDEERLALCLYTSYFYEPLNNYLRGIGTVNLATPFGKLIIKTAEVLKVAYEREAEQDIVNKRYRLELRSGWIEKYQDSIDFKGLTSTHPNINGVKSMWGDAAAGTFGPVTNIALLVFEGTAKIKHPVLKYFPNEEEDLMGPGTKYNIIAEYTIKGNIPLMGDQQIRVIHLSNKVSKGSRKNVDRLSFSDVV